MLGSNINIDQNGHMMILFSWGYYIEVPEPNGGFCRKIIELNRRFPSKACLIARVKWRILQALVCQAFNESSWAEFHLMALLTALNSGQISLVLKPEAGKSFGKPTKIWEKWRPFMHSNMIYSNPQKRSTRDLL